MKLSNKEAPGAKPNHERGVINIQKNKLIEKTFKKYQKLYHIDRKYKSITGR